MASPSERAKRLENRLKAFKAENEAQLQDGVDFALRTTGTFTAAALDVIAERLGMENATTEIAAPSTGLALVAGTAGFVGDSRPLRMFGEGHGAPAGYKLGVAATNAIWDAIAGEDGAVVD